MGTAYKNISVGIFILGFFGSVYLGQTIGYGFEWIPFLTGVVSTFIFCMQIYAIGEIIDQLECSNNNTQALCRLLKRLSPEEKKPIQKKAMPTAKNTAETEKDTVNEMSELVGWACQSCGAINDLEAKYCSECGNSIQ